MKINRVIGFILIFITLFLPIIIFFDIQKGALLFSVKQFLILKVGILNYFIFFASGIIGALIIFNRFEFNIIEFVKKSFYYLMLCFSISIYFRIFNIESGYLVDTFFKYIHLISSQIIVTFFINSIFFVVFSYLLYNSKDLIVYNIVSNVLQIINKFFMILKKKRKDIKLNLREKVNITKQKLHAIEQSEEYSNHVDFENEKNLEIDYSDIKKNNKKEKALYNQENVQKIINNSTINENEKEDIQISEEKDNFIETENAENEILEKQPKIINEITNKSIEEIEQSEDDIIEEKEKSEPYNEINDNNSACKYESTPKENQLLKIKENEKSKNLQKKTINFENYKFPDTSLLSKPVKINKLSQDEMEESLREQGEILVKTLQEFNIKCEIDTIAIGPTVVRFEIKLAPGIRVSKVNSLIDNIALALATPSVRIEAPIPGKSAIGIELPKEHPEIVNFIDLVNSNKFKVAKEPLTIALGKNIAGNIIIANLAKTPHLLVAGSTGSGKSVCMNTIIVSLLYRNHPDDLKFIMIDPKMVELAVYNDIPHLLTPVITDPKLASIVLKWAVDKMEERYLHLSKLGIRNIDTYNEVVEKQKRGEVPPEKMKYDQDGNELEKMSFIVIVIDELADLMMVAAKDVEESICRLAQKARAIGIHLIIATQRPSVDVITGVIKSNLPSRIAFAVKSQIDSRTILDEKGAEKLLGRGDMLFSMIGTNRAVRVQGAFISDEEIERILDYIKENSEPNYVEEITEYIDTVLELEENSKKGKKNKKLLQKPKTIETVEEEIVIESEEDLIEAAKRLIIDTNTASIAMLQRRLRVGNNKAREIMNELEKRGVVGPHQDKKPREILIKSY